MTVDPKAIRAAARAAVENFRHNAEDSLLKSLELRDEERRVEKLIAEDRRRMETRSAHFEWLFDSTQLRDIIMVLEFGLEQNNWESEEECTVKRAIAALTYLAGAAPTPTE